jgi:hypothetical protein
LYGKYGGGSSGGGDLHAGDDGGGTRYAPTAATNYKDATPSTPPWAPRIVHKRTHKLGALLSNLEEVEAPHSDMDGVAIETAALRHPNFNPHKKAMWGALQEQEVFKDALSVTEKGLIEFKGLSKDQAAKLKDMSFFAAGAVTESLRNKIQNQIESQGTPNPLAIPGQQRAASYIINTMQHLIKAASENELNVGATVFRFLADAVGFDTLSIVNYNAPINAIFGLVLKRYADAVLEAPTRGGAGGAGLHGAGAHTGSGGGGGKHGGGNNGSGGGGGGDAAKDDAIRQQLQANARHQQQIQQQLAALTAALGSAPPAQPPAGGVMQPKDKIIDYSIPWCLRRSNWEKGIHAPVCPIHGGQMGKLGHQGGTAGCSLIPKELGGLADAWSPTDPLTKPFANSTFKLPGNGVSASKANAGKLPLGE